MNHRARSSFLFVFVAFVFQVGCGTLTAPVKPSASASPWCVKVGDVKGGSGCANSPSPSLSSAPFFFSPVPYAAIGSSDAVGVGASVPCGMNTPTNPACPDGTGYVPKIAALLTSGGNPVVLDDLGITGATVGADIQLLGNLYGTKPYDMCVIRTGGDVITGDYLTNEVPKLSTDAAYITIFAGGNEVVALTAALGCGAGGSTSVGQAAFIAAEASAFANDYALLIKAVKKASPHARVVVANLPNFAGVPLGLTEPSIVRDALQIFTIAFDASINGLTSQNIPVADLLCDPRSYDPANFSSDGFHPNDAGYAAMASTLEPLLLNGSSHPSLACPQVFLADSSRRSFSRFTMRVP